MEKDYKKLQMKCFILQSIKIVLDIFAMISVFLTKRFRYMLYIFIILFILFLIETIMMYFINKEIYDYCSGKKKFSFKPFLISNKRFRELLKEGISSGTYILIEEEIHYIEVGRNCYVIDFTEFRKEEDFLQYEIHGIKIGDLKKIAFIAYDGNDPEEYLSKK